MRAPSAAAMTVPSDDGDGQRTQRQASGAAGEARALAHLQQHGLVLVDRNFLCKVGEIDLIMPLTNGARFDSYPAGWCVYEAGSGHRPTVTEGRALVLYLLPQGAIQFTPAAA